jgi:hypothetical protein
MVFRNGWQTTVLALVLISLYMDGISAVNVACTHRPLSVPHSQQCGVILWLCLPSWRGSWLMPCWVIVTTWLSLGLTNLSQVHATPYTLDTCMFNTYSSQKSKRHHIHTTHRPFPSISYTTNSQCLGFLNQQLPLLTLCCNFLGNTLSSTQCSHSIRHVSWLNYRGSF